MGKRSDHASDRARRRQLLLRRAHIGEIKAEKQIVFRYAGENPNGSMDDIAGIVNKKGNVLGMMPHPERAIDQLARLGRRQADVYINFERLEGKTWRSSYPLRNRRRNKSRSRKFIKQMGVTDEEYEHDLRISRTQAELYGDRRIQRHVVGALLLQKFQAGACASFPITGPRVLMGPGEGAGIVDIGDNQAVVFKIESHNHPSAIEPYQGAATGVGGIIRDIFSMGARPVALLNSLRFGKLDNDRVKYLFEHVVSGHRRLRQLHRHSDGRRRSDVRRKLRRQSARQRDVCRADRPR